jgi:outer membrane lipoprotein-sorting protein
MNKYYFLQLVYFYILSSFCLLPQLKSEDIHADLLNKLNENFPAEIYFSQIDSNNKKSNGWMVVGQKGLARVEFEPPNHLIMVADGNWLIAHDAQYDRTSFLPLDGGILGLLLSPEKFSDSNQLLVTKNKDKLYYSLISENFKGTELRIFFNKEFKELKGWNIIENNETTIMIKILEVHKINNLETLDKNIFKFPEFMRANLKGFLGPYDRKLKKIPTGKTN